MESMIGEKDKMLKKKKKMCEENWRKVMKIKKKNVK
jgi:hypothetical protein